MIGGKRRFNTRERRAFVLPRDPKTQVFEDSLHDAGIVDERDRK